MEFWFSAGIRLLVLTAASLSVALLAGSIWGALALAAGLLLLLIAHWRQLHALHRWLGSGQLQAVPDAHGIWGDVFAALYHVQRAQAREFERVSASLERFHTAASVLPDGVIILDAEDRIEWVNAVAAGQFGFDLGRDLGTPITHLIRKPEFAQHLARNEQREPLILRAGAEGDRRYSLLLIPFASDGRLLMSRDVTVAERADTIRRDFVANVSHELRTPLTVIVGFLEHMVQDPDMERSVRSRFLGMVQEQAQRMNRLVDDLLTLSRLESSPSLQVEEDVNMPELVRLLVDDGRALSNSRHVFDVDIGEAWLRGNTSELRSAFGNLVSNAVRYTQDGGTIRIRWGEGENGPVFSVSDSGVGIPAEHIPRLTERFYRVDKGRSASTGGTGLGLAIVKHVLQHHQAQLDIQSVLGQGSTFCAVFPGQRRLLGRSA